MSEKKYTYYKIEKDCVGKDVTGKQHYYIKYELVTPYMIRKYPISSDCYTKIRCKLSDTFWNFGAKFLINEE